MKKLGELEKQFTMKRHWKKAFVIILVLTIIGAVLLVASRGFGKEDEAVEDKEYTYNVKTMKVEPGLDYSFMVTGEAAVGQKANLLAERRANVQDIYVKAGDDVSEGDIIMLLHSESLDSSFLNTQLLFANAQANLSTTQAVANNQVASERLRFETAESQLRNTLIQNDVQKRQSEEALNSAKLNAELSVAQAEIALDTAEKSLNTTKALNASNLLVAQTGLNNSIRSLKTSMFTGLSTANELLEVSSDFRGSAGRYKDIVGNIAGNSKRDAEQALETAADAYVNVEDTYESMREASLYAEDALDKTLIVLNFTVPTGALFETVLNAYISSISQSLSSVRGGIANLESAEGSYLTTKVSNQANIIASEQQVESAKRALDSAKQEINGKSQAVVNAEAAHASTLAQLAAAEDNARRAVDSARLAYENAKRSAELQTLSARNAFVSTQDAMDQLNISRDKLMVRATFNGTIADIPVVLGEEVNAGTTLVVLENTDTMQIEVFLSREDADRIAVGDAVRIGEETGMIMSVSKSADPMNKKYKVEIDPQGISLNPGQFVRVEFTSTKGLDGDRLFIPITAVLISSNETYVWTIEDGKTVKVPVELGNIQGDHVEVLQGIDSGMEIIIKGGRIIETEGTLVEVKE